MATRKRDEARAIEQSRGYSDETRHVAKDSPGGWRSDYDEELRKFFSGDFVGESGLTSKFGSQLDRVRDGVNYGAGSSPMTFLGADSHGAAIWCRSDLPAKCVEFGRSGLGVNRVVNTLRTIPRLAAQAVVDKSREKFRKEFAAKHDRQPTSSELEAVWPEEETVQAAVAKALDQVAVLEAYYTPVPTMATGGLLGLGQYATVAPMTDTVKRAAKAWREEQRELEIARYRSATTVSQREAAERRAEWRAEIESIGTVLEDGKAELATHADESGGVLAVNIARRKKLLREQQTLAQQLDDLSARIKRISSEKLPAVDTEGAIRRRWDKPATRDDLKDALRRILDTARRVKTPELAASAQRQQYEALASAKRMLSDARAAYAAARQGHSLPVHEEPKRLSAKQRATIEAFEDATGIR